MADGWGGQNQRDILVSLGYDVDIPWRALPKKDREWILFTDDQPVVPVYAGRNPREARRALKRKDEPSYHTFANSQSALMKKRAADHMLSAECPVCRGKRLRRESLSVTFADLDITDLSRQVAVASTSRTAPYRQMALGWTRPPVHDAARVDQFMHSASLRAGAVPPARTLH